MILDEFKFHPISNAYLAWRPSFPGTTYEYSLPPAGDFDSDGQTNLMEFAYGTNPLRQNAQQPPELTQEGGHFIVCVPTHRPIEDGIRVTIQTSTDLATWTDAVVTPVIPAPVGLEKYKLEGIAETARVLYVRTRIELLGPLGQ